MESEYLFNSVLHRPSLLQYLEQSASSIPTFPPLTLNDAVSGHTLNFDAALSSLASSSAARDEFAIRDLITRLGNINGGPPHPLQQTIAALSSYTNPAGNDNNNCSSSCYNTPVNSPHKVNVHGLQRIPSVADFAPGYSSLSRSFNGRQSSRKERVPNRGIKTKPMCLDKSLTLSEADNFPAGSSRKRKASSDKEDDESQENKSNSKELEPPKDYIHVRARRGQATDSHSLAERVRREKISERMKLLQDLVPGCNKVTGKASMLDEIINYVQSLQRQVEFLSMKLASVNTRIDIDTETLASKEMFQSDHQIFGQDSIIDSSSIEQLDSLCQGLGFQLPSFQGMNPDHLHPLQLANFCEGDLQSIVDMADTNFNGSNVLKFKF